MHWNAIFNANDEQCDLYQLDGKGKAIIGLLKQEIIDIIRENFKRWVNKNFAKKYNLSEDDLQMVVSYKYAKSGVSKKHILNYITHPTLNNREYADLYIKALSNNKKGGYPNEPYEAVGELALLKQNICDNCGASLWIAKKAQ